MPKNFYNLPPPWNPGYAMPDNVMDEGLERRTFVTGQMPRGTYDNSTDGSAGYAIPQYVLKEGTGRGTFTTKWLPRGYYGPKLPHWLDDIFSKVIGPKKALPGGGTAMTVATLGDVGGGSRGSLSNPWNTYGQRSAKIILRKLRTYPAASRPAVLKTMLDAIDPNLYTRVDSMAKQAASDGVPTSQALEYALAKAMTSGILTELDQIGRSRTPPQSRSLLGLGIYGPLSGEKGVSNIVDAAGTGQVYTQSANPNEVMLQVGPWFFPDKVGASVTMTKENTTQGITKQVLDALTKATATFTATKSGGVSGPWGSGSAPPNLVDYDKGALEKMFGTGSGAIAKVLVDGTYPVFKFKHPTSGKRMGLRITGLGTKDHPKFTVTVIEIPNTWLGALIDSLVELVAKIINVVKDIAAAVGNIACNALQVPGAAGAAAAATGGAAAAGVVVAGALCNNPPPPPPLLPQSDSLMVPLLLGGAAIAAIALIKHKKKA